jgi:SAM-dependent methyltransferase
MVLRTNTRRWKKVAFAGRPSWDGRNAIIASFIPAGSSVLDIGCGSQTLREHLSSGCKYQPSDIIKSSPDVIFCDLNAGIYPDTKELFDYVVCSGVFEYIRNPKEFFKRIPRLGHAVIISYNPHAPGGSKFSRLAHNWLNHFTKDDLLSLFSEMGLEWTVLHTSERGEIICCLREHIPAGVNNYNRSADVSPS